MIPAGGRLFDGCLPLGEKTGQKNRTLHLGTGDGGTVINATQGAAMNSKRRRLFGTLGYNVGAHLPERRNNAVHGPAGERGISHQAALEGLTGE